VKRQPRPPASIKVFRAAGFFWGESGCSCARRQWDRGEAGSAASLTTKSSKFRRPPGEGRAHPSGEPATAAAAAIAGRIVDVRQMDTWIA